MLQSLIPLKADITGYLEHPVKGASTAFAILFTISGILHIWQSRYAYLFSSLYPLLSLSSLTSFTCSKYKSWPCIWLLPCACFIFTAGFGCRENTAYFPTSDSTFTASQGLLYSAV
jgi:hypothetical protein